MLIVDDRLTVADTAGIILQDFGYRILVANGPLEALEILAGQTRIDLLFTDLITPCGKNGVMLARAAKERQPKIKVLITTGTAEVSLERTDAGGSEFEGDQQALQAARAGPSSAPGDRRLDGRQLN